MGPEGLAELRAPDSHRLSRSRARGCTSFFRLGSFGPSWPAVLEAEAPGAGPAVLMTSSGGNRGLSEKGRAASMGRTRAHHFLFPSLLRCRSTSTFNTFHYFSVMCPAINSFVWFNVKVQKGRCSDDSSSHLLVLVAEPLCCRKPLLSVTWKSLERRTMQLKVNVSYFHFPKMLSFFPLVKVDILSKICVDVYRGCLYTNAVAPVLISGDQMAGTWSSAVL